MCVCVRVCKESYRYCCRCFFTHTLAHKFIMDVIIVSITHTLSHTRIHTYIHTNINTHTHIHPDIY